MPAKKNLEKKYDSVLETIRLYPQQINQAWEEINKIEIPHDFEHINKVAVCGMGGSGLGARIVDSLLVNRIRVPVEVFNQYNIPNYTDANTLIIPYSYSGNTEETIEAINEAIVRDAKIFGVTTGGKLLRILEKYDLPKYIIDDRFNPSGQPRFGLGYAVGAILTLFSKINLAHISDFEIEDAMNTMSKFIKEYDESVEKNENLAKNFSSKLESKAVMFVASEHLYGVAYAIKNQFNETAKTFSDVFELPELNHHLMEGLGKPAKLRDIIHFVFVKSNLYSERVQLRYPLTADVIEKNAISYSFFSPRSQTKINQVFETLVFGSFVVYYLAKNYHIDPTEIPWVDYFKEKLGKR